VKVELVQHILLVLYIYGFDVHSGFNIVHRFSSCAVAVVSVPLGTGRRCMHTVFLTYKAEPMSDSTCEFPHKIYCNVHYYSSCEVLWLIQMYILTDSVELLFPVRIQGYEFPQPRHGMWVSCVWCI
jgi:hypothetical protein